MANSDPTLILLTAATASAPPTLTDATAGQPRPYSTDQGVILVHSTAGTGVLTALVRLWGFHAGVGRWYDLGTLNNSSAIGEISTIADTIAYAEPVQGLMTFTRFHAEIIGALGGTATAITVVLSCVRDGTVSA